MLIWFELLILKDFSYYDVQYNLEKLQIISLEKSFVWVPVKLIATKFTALLMMVVLIFFQLYAHDLSLF